MRTQRQRSSRIEATKRAKFVEVWLASDHRLQGDSRVSEGPDRVAVVGAAVQQAHRSFREVESSGQVLLRDGLDDEVADLARPAICKTSSKTRSDMSSENRLRAWAMDDSSRS